MKLCQSVGLFSTFILILDEGMMRQHLVRNGNNQINLSYMASAAFPARTNQHWQRRKSRSLRHVCYRSLVVII